MDKILAGMKEYFANTSEEQIEKDWQELAEYNQFGPKAKDFVEERLFCGGFFGTQPKINAKNSISYLVLKYAFSFAIIVIIIFAVNLWFFCRSNDNGLLSGILEISKVVVPIITLVLGYVFGQNKL